MSLTLNGLGVASMKWLAGWNGPWIAELEMQSDVEITPIGKAVIASTTGISLVGTVDAKSTGKFGEKRRARVIAGGDGWRKKVRAQHFHSEVALPLSVIVAATATECGEVATTISTKTVVDFVRRNAPASQVFNDAGVDWWVDLTGITIVGTRVPLPPHPTLEVQDWDPETETLSFTCDVLPQPGTVLADTRLGKKIVRQVSAVVSGASVTGTLWVADTNADAGTISELVDGLAKLARDATRAEAGRVYEYRVIAMAGSRVQVQAVKPGDGMPAIIPLSVWSGISGYKAILRPSSRVLVGFRSGDPTQPYIAAHEPPDTDGWRPVKLEFDAISSVEIGAQSISVLLGQAVGAQPIAKAPPIVAAFAAVVVYAQALAKILPVHEPAASALAGALAAVGTSIPSAKVLAS